jgi:peptidoglycan/xylan/chitin deacetylase (PgdA/CDA1 family)
VPRPGHRCTLLLVLLLLAGCGTTSNSSSTNTEEDSTSDLAVAPPATPEIAFGVGGGEGTPDPAAARCATPDRLSVQGSRSDSAQNLVIVGSLNLRSGPGVDCDTVGTLNFGTLVSSIGPEITLKRHVWRFVSTPQGDGFVVSSAIQPLPEQTPGIIPVLMYHRIGEGDGPLFVSRNSLEAQLKWLRDQGYVALTPADLVSHIDYGLPMPARPIIISIDDYWEPTPDFMRLLEKYGFRGTYVLPNGAQLTEEEIIALARQGQVCGHTVTHPYLDSLPPEDQKRQIKDNKKWLERIVGMKVTCFAYPFGHFNDTTIATVESAGYEIAFGASGGQAHLATLDRWNVPRIEVSGDWTLEDFIWIMEDIQRRS